MEREIEEKVITKFRFGGGKTLKIKYIYIYIVVCTNVLPILGCMPPESVSLFALAGRVLLVQSFARSPLPYPKRVEH